MTICTPECRLRLTLFPRAGAVLVQFLEQRAPSGRAGPRPAPRRPRRARTQPATRGGAVPPQPRTAPGSRPASGPGNQQQPRAGQAGTRRRASPPMMYAASSRLMPVSSGSGLFVGPSGVGKSHAAQALGHIACRKGYEVTYERTSVLLDWIRASLGSVPRLRPGSTILTAGWTTYCGHDWAFASKACSDGPWWRSWSVLGGRCPATHDRRRTVPGRDPSSTPHSRRDRRQRRTYDSDPSQAQVPAVRSDHRDRPGARHSGHGLGPQRPRSPTAAGGNRGHRAGRTRRPAGGHGTASRSLRVRPRRAACSLREKGRRDRTHLTGMK